MRLRCLFDFKQLQRIKKIKEHIQQNPESNYIFECLFNEYHGEQHGKTFLCETCHVANVRSQIESHDDEQNQCHPQANVQPEGQVVETIGSVGNKKNFNLFPPD